MSKPVRIRNDVAAQVELKADAERRSFANMVEVLLLAALTERDNGVKGSDAGRNSAEPRVPLGGESTESSASPAPSPARSVSAESVPPGVHSVGMAERARGLALRDGKCSADVARGTRCKLCGKVHS